MPRPEVSCSNCEAACCKGSRIFSLSLEEAAFMLKGGNKLITVAFPTSHDRDDVVYPLGYEEGENGRVVKWLTNPDNPNEPLRAGLGRYILVDSCKYIEVDESGHEYCGVYEQRPEVCRVFEMGSPKCLLMREEFGVPLPMPTMRSKS